MIAGIFCGVITAVLLLLASARDTRKTANRTSKEGQ